eukprot:4348711-Lingulodinium_polyedra.AAC.1
MQRSRRRGRSPSRRSSAPRASYHGRVATPFGFEVSTHASGQRSRRAAWSRPRLPSSLVPRSAQRASSSPGGSSKFWQGSA